MMYNYYEAVKEDVIEAIKNEYNMNDYESREDLEEALNDDLWIDDGVTGNASGSYTCNSYAARDYVLGDMDTVAEALREFCTDAETIADKFLNENWEWLDVTVRCYVLGSAIYEALDELGADEFYEKKSAFEPGEAVEIA